MSLLLEMFTYPFILRAFVVGILVALCAALLGVPLVLKRYSMIGDGLSHVSFGALAIAVALLIPNMGGIVGLNYCSEFLSNDATDKTAADVTFDQLAAHIEHWLDLGGEDVIALGGDWDGATVPAFLSDASMMPEFQNMLSKHFGKTVMQKLCSDNALAFFERY